MKIMKTSFVAILTTGVTITFLLGVMFGWKMCARRVARLKNERDYIAKKVKELHKLEQKFS